MAPPEERYENISHFLFVGISRVCEDCAQLPEEPRNEWGTNFIKFALKSYLKFAFKNY